METQVVDETMKQLKQNGYREDIFIYDREKSREEDLAKRFSHASKRGNKNIGKCDIILYSKERNLIVLVECKSDRKKHGTMNDTGKNAIIDKAVPGVIHYMKNIWEEGNRTLGENILGLAVSGVENRRVSLFGICNEQIQGGDFLVKNLYDGDKILSYSEAITRLYAFDNIPGVQTILSDEFTVIGMKASQLEHLKVSTQHQRYYSSKHKDDILFSLSKKLTDKGKIDIIGIIIIGFLEGTYHIIDGQHRFYAYQDLFKHRKYDFTVLIQYIVLSNLDHIKELYNMHYKALEASESEKELPTKDWSYLLANQVMDKIADKYCHNGKSIVNESSRSPNIHRSNYIDLFIKFLKKNPEKYKMTSCEVIMKKLIKKNLEISTNIPRLKGNKNKEYSENTLKIAKNFNCWLGLVWPDKWLN